METAIDYEKTWQGPWNDTTRYGPACRHRRRIVANLIRRVPHETILDIGCGDGSLLSEISKKIKARLFGTDISGEAIKIATQRVPAATFVQMDLSKELPQGRYDVAVLSEVLEHIEDDVTALKRIAPLARYVVISVPGGPADEVGTQFGHFRNYSGDRLRRLIEQAGLDVVYYRRWGWPFYDAIQKILDSCTDAASVAGGRYTPTRKFVAAMIYALFFLNVLPFGTQVFAIGRTRT